MKINKLIGRILLFSGIFFAVLSSFVFPARAEFSHKDFTQGQRAFALDLLKDKMTITEDNPIVSSLSVYILADMLANGAKGETLLRLKDKILCPDTDCNLNTINEITAAYIKSLSQAEINNSIWGNDFASEYVKTVEKLFAEAYPLPDNTSDIDNWISEKTHGGINQLLGDNPTEEDDLYLVNTIYFKDKWRIEFKKRDTQKKNFYSLDATKPDKVNLMHLHDDSIPYFENNKFQAIRLSYAHGDKITIILPNEDIDFREFVKDLKPEDLDIDYSSIYNVEVFLPRFELEAETDVAPYFKKQEIPIFLGDEGKDFSALRFYPSHVREIKQKAKIRLDEEGTEVKVATYASMMNDSLGDDNDYRQPKIFRADRPFIFIINDGLLIGAYTRGNLTSASEVPEKVSSVWQKIWRK